MAGFEAGELRVVERDGGPVLHIMASAVESYDAAKGYDFIRTTAGELALLTSCVCEPAATRAHRA